MKEAKKTLEWEENLAFSGIKAYKITPGPGAYQFSRNSLRGSNIGYSFGQHMNNEMKIKLGCDPAFEK